MKKTLFGLICLLLAAWVLLQGNFGIPLIQINIWPLLVILGFVYFAVENFFEGHWGTGLVSGFIAFLIANNVYRLFPHLSSGTVFLAGILAYVGVRILFKPRTSWKSRHRIDVSSGSEEGITFGSGTRYVNSDNFTYDELACSFGNAKVYFDNAQIVGDSATFKVEVAFGNATLFVPSSWQVISKAACSFGSVSQIRNVNEKEKTLYLEGSVAFGHLKIIYI
ncbi:LiaF transmembrane domain-containing protein [Streptococcus oricebi]|uniref:LiaF transmembrane domain-containing protein n=1 Tax=Streptococcus oricebi TaxID=1547447 RepID=A0ABS5B5I0_9STRE|nr:hypothetical protein [Streptococcus oricebi]MBP2624060.1 hypothetical protein [Streptococcus oricebi]